MFGLITGFFGRIAGLLGGAALLSFLGPIVPIIAGIGSAIGAVITAIAEIITAMSKSPEGRVCLALVAAGLAFLYVRFHYIEEGKALGIASVKPKTEFVTRTVPAKCPAPKLPTKQAAAAPPQEKKFLW